MSKTQEIWSVLAQVTGTEFKTVGEYGRRIREAGYFTRETRGKNSPRATHRDVAHLLVAVMSGASTRTSAEALSRFESAEIPHGDHKHIMQFQDSSGPAGKLFRDVMPEMMKEDHTLFDAIAAIIRLAHHCPDYFRQQDKCHDFELRIYPSHYRGEIDFFIPAPMPTDPNIIDVMLEYNNNGLGIIGDLERVNRVSCRTFFEIGMCLRRWDSQ